MVRSAAAAALRRQGSRKRLKVVGAENQIPSICGEIPEYSWISVVTKTVSEKCWNAAAPTLFSERLFLTHRNPLNPLNIQEFHCKLIEFDFLHQ